jgi:hypothetical protein
MTGLLLDINRTIALFADCSGDTGHLPQTAFDPSPGCSRGMPAQLVCGNQMAAAIFMPRAWFSGSPRWGGPPVCRAEAARRASASAGCRAGAACPLQQPRDLGRRARLSGMSSWHRPPLCLACSHHLVLPQSHPRSQMLE